MFELNSQGVTRFLFALKVGNEEIVKQVVHSVHENIPISDYSIFTKKYENKTLVPFSVGFFFHAGFDEERESKFK